MNLRIRSITNWDYPHFENKEVVSVSKEVVLADIEAEELPDSLIEAILEAASLFTRG